MRALTVFNHMALDGYFVDAAGDMSWAKADPQDPEWNATRAFGNGNVLLAYEPMA